MLWDKVQEVRGEIDKVKEVLGEKDGQAIWCIPKAGLASLPMLSF